ncbi:MAG: cation-translocating P-type ATPase, partial [Nitrososphaerales archaeon]
PVADQTNMLFSGTSVTDGKGVAVSVSTGMHTELGKIARQVTERTPKSYTSLERRMNEIGRKIGVIVLIIVCAIVTISLSEEYVLTGEVTLVTTLSIMLFGVALAVAAIPEALPAIMVGSLAIGAHAMAKENALARNLSAVETLGSTQVVCTDKTGTLTKGEMTATELYAAEKTYLAGGVGYEPVGQVSSVDGSINSPRILEDLARAIVLCNDAVLVKEKDGKHWAINGDPTEGALVVLAEKLGLSQRNVRSSFPRVWEIPFSSETKRMITVHTTGSGEEIAYMKGAPESVLEKCVSYFQGSRVIPLDSMGRDRIQGVAESMAGRALRVLAVARRETTSDKTHLPDSLEREFVFLGLIGMIDPPRPEAIEAIIAAKKIGMKPIMITGDHKSTALAIAGQMGIYQEGDLALTGKELQLTSDHDYEKIVEQVTVYARVTPFDKLRIVDAWQKKDKIVAMTGDGVNDAPALKKADIGIAMGITGTEVAKDAADMILLDDNFATIMKAVKLGRWIQDNVKKYLAYLLSANLVEITVLSIGALAVSLFIANATNEPLLPLLAVQVLYINLATDGLPALAVGIGPPDPDIMERMVPKKSEPTVFSTEVRRFILWILAAETPLLVLVYLTGLPLGIDEGRTRLFLAFVFVELVIALNCSSLRFTINKAKPHKWLVLSVVWEAFLIILLLQIPQARDALHLVTPTLGDVEWTAIPAAFTFAYIEVLKHYFVPREIARKEPFMQSNAPV